MRLQRPLAIISGLLVLLVACSPTTAPSSSGGPAGGTGSDAAPRANTPKRVVVGAREAAPVLSVALDGHADVVQELVSSGLIGFDPKGEPFALLAEAVPSIENGLWKVTPDGRMEVSWKIREGLKWHDGTPITSDDVLFAVQVGRDRELPDFGNAAFNALGNVTAPDARTVTTEWTKPFIQADNMFSWEAVLPLPKHLLEDAYLNNKSSFTQHRYWSHEFVHAGPFKVRDFVPTERLVLDAFDGYALGRPIVDQVEVRFISDANTLAANLIAGEVHFTIGPGLAVDQSLAAQERWPGGKMGVYPYQGGTVARPQFQNPNPVAQLDLRFRRALFHAIDREALNDSITRGYAPVSGYQVPPGAPEFDEINTAVVQYPYDPRRSAQLLEEAGLTRVGDSFRDAAGNELNVEVQVAGSDTGQEQAALFLADSWQRIGVSAAPKLLSAAAATREARAIRPAFEISSFSIATRQPARIIWYHSSDIPSPESNYRRGGNYSRYSNPELDSLVDRFYSTVPRQERIEVLKQIARHATENVIVMSLYHTVHASLISNRVSNVTPRTGQAQTFESHKWDIQ